MYSLPKQEPVHSMSQKPLYMPISSPAELEMGVLGVGRLGML